MHLSFPSKATLILEIAGQSDSAHQTIWSIAHVTQGTIFGRKSPTKMRVVSKFVVLLHMIIHERGLGFSSNSGMDKPPYHNALSVRQLEVALDDNSQVDGSRRRLFQSMPAIMISLSCPQSSRAVTATGPSDGNLPDLPSDAVRSYLQYRIPLQISADYYVFDLQRMVGDVEQW